MMKSRSFRWNMTGLTAILFYAVCGLMLLLWPDFALAIANYALAAVLCIVGVVMIVAYFRSAPYEASLGFNLSIGLVLSLLGILLFANSEILVALLPFLWGLAMIAGGFAKLQMAFDLKRMRDAHWWLMLIGAGISVVLGVFSVAKPIFIATIATQFMGVSLLVEAVLDLAAWIALKRRIREAFPEGSGKAE